MVTEYPSLADVLPYHGFLGPGRVDLRDEGILQGYWLRGPSPDISDDADLLKCSEQLGRAPVHFRKGDSIQIVYDKRPAPKPPELQYSHPATAMVMAEMLDHFTAEEHWITPTRLYLTHQYEKPLKSAVRAFMLGGCGPQRLNRHDLLQQDAVGRFQAFEDAIKKAITLNRMSNLDMFRDLLHCVTYRDLPAPPLEPQVRLNHVLKIFKSFFGWDKSDDQDAKKQIKDLNDAIAESQDGTPFGTVSCVAIVRDEDPDQADLRAHNLYSSPMG